MWPTNHRIFCTNWKWLLKNRVTRSTMFQTPPGGKKPFSWTKSRIKPINSTLWEGTNLDFSQLISNPSFWQVVNTKECCIIRSSLVGDNQPIIWVGENIVPVQVQKGHNWSHTFENTLGWWLAQREVQCTEKYIHHSKNVGMYNNLGRWKCGSKHLWDQQPQSKN